VTRGWLFGLLLFFASFSLACSKSDPEPKPAPSSNVATSATLAMPTGPLVLARGVRIERAGAGSDAARVVRESREREKHDGRDVVVYVGAKWCEPCKRFHKAAAAGELDDAFPTLTLLEFDLDEDKERLEEAGYRSELIPLFVMPDDDGRATSKRFEGSVKGDGAIANIAPRLRALIAR
jgi:thiol-disulfide isomerase/thioredoxin